MAQCGRSKGGTAPNNAPATDHAYGDLARTVRGFSPGLKLLALRFEPMVDQALRRV
jgi:hypothetical protein